MNCALFHPTVTSCYNHIYDTFCITLPSHGPQFQYNYLKHNTKPIKINMQRTKASTSFNLKLCKIAFLYTRATTVNVILLLTFTRTYKNPGLIKRPL